MFRRKPKAEPDRALQLVTFTLEEDDGSFSGESRDEIGIQGFDLLDSAGVRLAPNDRGPAAEGIFFFKLAGCSHHPDSGRLDGDALPRILVRHRPDNPHDPNAIEVLTQDGGRLTGFVPASLAPIMRSYLSQAIIDRKPVAGSTGMVAKTFHKGGKVVGAQAVVAADGYQVQFRSAT